MAVILLFLIGVLAGWIASVITRDEAPRAILTRIGIALVASLFVGLIINGGTFLGSLSWLAGCAGLVGSIAALFAHYFFLGRRSQA